MKSQTSGLIFMVFFHEGSQMFKTNFGIMIGIMIEIKFHWLSAEWLQNLPL